MALPNGNRNGCSSNGRSENIMKIIIFLSLVALLQIRKFGSSYSEEYKKGIRSAVHQGEVHSAHISQVVSNVMETESSNEPIADSTREHTSVGDTLGSEIVEKNTDTESFEEEDDIGNGSTPLSGSVFMDSGEETEKEQTLSIETETTPAFSSNDTGIQQVENKTQHDSKSEEETVSQSTPISVVGTTALSLNNETMTGWSTLESSSKDTNVTGDALSYNSSFALSTSNASQTKTDTENSENSSSGAYNETDFSASLEQNSTETATKIAVIDADNTTNNDFASFQKNSTGVVDNIVWSQADQTVDANTSSFRKNSTAFVNKIVRPDDSNAVNTNPNKIVWPEPDNSTNIDSVSSQKNSTSSVNKFVWPDNANAYKKFSPEADNTTNTDTTLLQKNWTDQVNEIVRPDLNNTNASNRTKTSGETTGNGTLVTAIVSNQTELVGELSPEEKQYELWKSTKENFDATKPWQNSSTFTRVNRDVYRQVVEKAQTAVKSVVEDVYTDCEMYILPTIGEDGGLQNEAPRIQYKCLRDDNPILKDDLCHTVNLCRVIIDEEAWKEAGSPMVSTANATNSTVDTNNSPEKTTVLMLVDSIDYMMKAEVFDGLLNKASYAYRSNRLFYIWIGNLNEDELNRREVESLAPTFGFRCAEQKLQNSMHYYKPIAFLALFDTLASSSEISSSILYLDADTAFTPTAFDRIENDKFDGKSGENENLLGPIGPESYFGLSPQASLMATTNMKGRMLMNSGVMLLRDTRWSRDLSALWWYGRCGSKDQLALWLILYATFSAWTSSGESSIDTEGENMEGSVQQFSYPGGIFFDYSSANMKLFMHFKKSARNLQAAWEAVIEQRQKEQISVGVERTDEDDYSYPIPTNTKLYNGGKESLGPKLWGPMELPHVVILSPMRAVSYNKTIQLHTSEDSTTLNIQVDLPKLKSDQDDGSLVIHSKSGGGCSHLRCWPYIKN